MNEAKSEKIFLKSLRVQGFRSLYDVFLSPGSINIFVGSHGSGKTNLMSLFRFFRDVVTDPTTIEGYRSSAPSLIWRGAEGSDRTFQATFYFGYPDQRTLCYDVIVSDNLTFVREELKEEQGSGRVFLLRNRERLELHTARGEKEIASVNPNRISLNVLSRMSPLSRNEAIPEIDSLIEFIREWRVVMMNINKVRKSLSRRILADRISGIPPLKPSGENLGEFLLGLSKNDPELFELIVERFKAAMSKRIDKLTGKTFLGEMRSFVFEEPGKSVYRFSPKEEPDSVIRLLTVFSLLFGDRKASLICLEEPDSGLYPQVMLHLADALRYYEAAKEPYPQIFVTTHNPVFLNCFDLLSESAYLRIFRVERDLQDGKTRINQVDPQEAKKWLEEHPFETLYTSKLVIW